MRKLKILQQIHTVYSEQMGSGTSGSWNSLHLHQILLLDWLHQNHSLCLCDMMLKIYNHEKRESQAESFNVFIPCLNLGSKQRSGRKGQKESSFYGERQPLDGQMCWALMCKSRRVIPKETNVLSRSRVVPKQWTQLLIFTFPVPYSSTSVPYPQGQAWSKQCRNPRWRENGDQRK